MHKELVDTKQNLQENLQIKEELHNQVAVLNAQVSQSLYSTCNNMSRYPDNNWLSHYF